MENPGDVVNTIWTAFDVIIRIAVDPVIARYVVHADFARDSNSHNRPRDFLADTLCRDAVLKLLATSAELKQAGLDWREYYAQIEEDLQARRYSQYAAAFLMTLLPNLKTLILPNKWKPNDATNKLVDIVISKAREPHLPPNRPSLAQVTKFEVCASVVAQSRFDLDWVVPFLALTHIRSFYGISCLAVGVDGHKGNLSTTLQGGFGQALTVVDLWACCIDASAIDRFLRHTRHLRSLRYSHTTKTHTGPQEWDICRFITAIERQVGLHLEELSVSIRNFHEPIAPGETSTRGFHRLRKLELPLEVAVCNATAAAVRLAAARVKGCTFVEDGSVDGGDLLISDLVPNSVSQLSLISNGTGEHAKILDLMFQHFAARRTSTLPALDEIQLIWPDYADDAYKEQSSTLLLEFEKTGVVARLNEYHTCSDMTWQD